jgi:hypothetical protein
METYGYLARSSARSSGAAERGGGAAGGSAQARFPYRARLRRKALGSEHERKALGHERAQIHSSSGDEQSRHRPEASEFSSKGRGARAKISGRTARICRVEAVRPGDFC